MSLFWAENTPNLKAVSLSLFESVMLHHFTEPNKMTENVDLNSEYSYLL